MYDDYTETTCATTNEHEDRLAVAAAAAFDDD